MDGQNNWDPNAPQGQTDQPGMGTPTGQVNPTPAGDTGNAPGGAPTWTPPTSPTPEPTVPEPTTPEPSEPQAPGEGGEDNSGQTPPTGVPGV